MSKYQLKLPILLAQIWNTSQPAPLRSSLDYYSSLSCSVSDLQINNNQQMEINNSLQNEIGRGFEPRTMRLLKQNRQTLSELKTKITQLEKMEEVLNENVQRIARNNENIFRFVM
ncbi:Hypothetical_protein [Hexamita inflata]|uniref:Hypothetical_protein n=1 Tax=Hexamita inflata TaxID=28002 RepID=A0AA86QE75_9EUKA|nr:Hypothetical protein HINF_LOCUS40973 [Hexamita inflata]